MSVDRCELMNCIIFKTVLSSRNWILWSSKGKETSFSSTQNRQHMKRNRIYEDDGVEKLSKQIGDVAFAIHSLSKNQLDVNVLYIEVMKIKGFDEITFGDAFDHLVQNKMLAKAFMAKAFTTTGLLTKRWFHYIQNLCSDYICYLISMFICLIQSNIFMFVNLN